MLSPTPTPYWYYLVRAHLRQPPDLERWVGRCQPQSEASLFGPSFHASVEVGEWFVVEVIVLSGSMVAEAA